MIILDTNIIANGATSQYGCIGINSISKFGQKYFGASENGLYEFTGSDDDGVDIESYLQTAQMNFGLTNEKRLRFVYVKYEATDEITLTVSTEYGLSEDYIIPASSDIQKVYRVTINRSLAGSYWQFKFAGANFALDEVSVLPIIRNHKLS